MKMASAVIEVDREARQWSAGAIAVHDGRDPSDSERTDRALALTGTLEALANHLERIPGRRKSLLLFSEGVDYDQADVLGKVQRNASDVMRGMGRAVGALMRTNVALYAVDPRGAQLGRAGSARNAALPPRRGRATRWQGAASLTSRTIRSGRCGRSRIRPAVSPRSIQRLRRRLPAHSRREQRLLRHRLLAGAASEAGRIPLDRRQGLPARRLHQRPQRLYRQGCLRRPAGGGRPDRTSRRRPGFRPLDAGAWPRSRALGDVVRAGGSPRPVGAAAGPALEPAAAAGAADSRPGHPDARRRQEDRGPPGGRGAGTRLAVRRSWRPFERAPRARAADSQRKRARVERDVDRHRPAADARGSRAREGHRRPLAVGAGIAARPPPVARRRPRRAHRRLRHVDPGHRRARDSPRRLRAEWRDASPRCRRC